MEDLHIVLNDGTQSAQVAWRDTDAPLKRAMVIDRKMSPPEIAKTIDKATVSHKGDIVVVVPVYWEHHKDAFWADLITASSRVAAVKTPLSKSSLFMIYEGVFSHEDRMGVQTKMAPTACIHATPHLEESCGMCLDCLEHYLVLNKLGKTDRWCFLENPLTGYDSQRRLIPFLNRMGSKESKGITPLEIAVADLLVEAFVKDTLPEGILALMDRNHQSFIRQWA